MIELINVNKSFNGNKIIDNVSFKIPEAQKCVILGPSGSGKTTLLRLIAGFEAIDTGEIRINGECANKLAPHKRNVGMVFQDLALWPHMSVKEHLFFSLVLKGNKREKIEEILNVVGLMKYVDYYPHQLSGGEKQRLALARSLITNPRILLFDEPLSNIDSLLKGDLLKLILNLQEKYKITAIYVTHNHDEAFVFSDNLIIFHQGKIEQAGRMEEVRSNPKSEFVKLFLRGNSPK